MPNPHRAGVGLRLSPQPNGEYEVVYTQEGGPAFASGEILPGDVLLTVDGTPISHATLEFVAEKMIGEIGSEISLCLRSGKSGMIRVVRLRRALANELPGQLRAFHPDGGKFFHDPSYSPLVPPGSFVRTHVPSPTRRQSRSPPPSTSPTWPRTSPRARPLSLSAGSDHVPPHPRALRGSPPPASPPKTSPGARRFWQQSALPSNGSYVVPGSEPWPGPQGSNKDARVVGVI